MGAQGKTTASRLARDYTAGVTQVVVELSPAGEPRNTPRKAAGLAATVQRVELVPPADRYSRQSRYRITTDLGTLSCAPVETLHLVAELTDASRAAVRDRAAAELAKRAGGDALEVGRTIRYGTGTDHTGAAVAFSDPVVVLSVERFEHGGALVRYQPTTRKRDADDVTLLSARGVADVRVVAEPERTPDGVAELAELIRQADVADYVRDVFETPRLPTRVPAAGDLAEQPAPTLAYHRGGQLGLLLDVDTAPALF